MLWYLYTVTSEDRFLDGTFHRMIDSLPKMAQIFVAYRGFTPEPNAHFAGEVYMPLATSLSDARNAAMEAFPPAKDVIVAFPDDDCWYPANLANSVETYLDSFDFVLGVVDMKGTEGSDFKESCPVDLALALTKSASAAMWIKSSFLANFRFDERLGLGAIFKAGEDLDLVVHVLCDGAIGLFSESIRVGHPLRDRTMEYFPGSLAVLAKYRHSKISSTWPLIRRLSHGMIFFLTGRLSLSTLLLGFRATLEGKSKS